MWEKKIEIDSSIFPSYIFLPDGFYLLADRTGA
jgi:hypothetical protein